MFTDHSVRGRKVFTPRVDDDGQVCQSTPSTVSSPDKLGLAFALPVILVCVSFPLGWWNHGFPPSLSCVTWTREENPTRTAQRSDPDVFIGRFLPTLEE